MKQFGLTTKLLLLILSVFIGNTVAKAALSAGDIAIIQYNADGTEVIKFLAMTDIAAGEVIYITDQNVTYNTELEINGMLLTEVDLKNVESGVYQLNIVTEHSIETMKIAVQQH